MTCNEKAVSHTHEIPIPCKESIRAATVLLSDSTVSRVLCTSTSLIKCLGMIITLSNTTFLLQQTLPSSGLTLSHDWETFGQLRASITSTIPTPHRNWSHNHQLQVFTVVARRPRQQLALRLRILRLPQCCMTHPRPDHQPKARNPCNRGNHNPSRDFNSCRNCQANHVRHTKCSCTA